MAVGRDVEQGGQLSPAEGRARIVLLKVHNRAGAVLGPRESAAETGRRVLEARGTRPRASHLLSADCPRRTRRMSAADDRRGKVDRALLGNPVRDARKLDELVGAVDVLLG